MYNTSVISVYRYKNTCSCFSKSGLHAEGFWMSHIVLALLYTAELRLPQNDMLFERQPQKFRMKNSFDQIFKVV